MRYTHSQFQSRQIGPTRVATGLPWPSRDLGSLSSFRGKPMVKASLTSSDHLTRAGASFSPEREILALRTDVWHGYARQWRPLTCRLADWQISLPLWLCGPWLGESCCAYLLCRHLMDMSLHHVGGILALTYSEYWRLQTYQIISASCVPRWWRSTTMKLAFAPDNDHPREYHQSVLPLLISTE